MSGKITPAPKVIKTLKSVTSKPKKTSKSIDAEDVSPNVHHLMKKDINHESVVFVWLETEGSSSINLVGSLRSVHDSVRSFSSSAACLDMMRSMKEQVFFICSFFNMDLLMTVQKIDRVEAIFVLEPHRHDIRIEIPKLIGIFIQQEELLRSLRETLEAFEQLQLERFSFETDPLFLWFQLWKTEFINRKPSSNKADFIEIARFCYRDNSRIMEMIEDFEKSYRPSEVLHWCFRSPFPNQFLHHAIRSHDADKLSVCRFIFIDASRFFHQQPKNKSSEQFYRGMKLTKELLDLFESNVGHLVCTSGFFPCTKSRTNALACASSPGYRSDLSSVLFKIDCDPTTLYSQLSNKTSPDVILFDVSTSFRLINVHRGQMSVIKMKPAVADGRLIAQEYVEQHPNQSIKSILDALQPSPPLEAPPPSAPTPLPTNTPRSAISTSSSSVDYELEAQKHLERDEIDLAIAAYRRSHPVSARILKIIGKLYVDKKGDYADALECHAEALKIQEKTGEDACDTLTTLGNIHHHLGQYNLALDYHGRALIILERAHSDDIAARVTNLIAIVNAHCARREFDQAIEMVHRALKLQETVQTSKDTSVGNLLAMLANIYQDAGKHREAFETCTKALAIFEQILLPDSQVIAELLESMGVIQIDLHSLDGAQQSFQRAVDIYQKILPSGHPSRVSAEIDLQRVVRLIQKKKSKPKKTPLNNAS